MAINNSWELFGFDLRRIGALWQQGWEEVARWRLARPFVTPLPVIVQHADGQFARWSGDEARPLDKQPAAPGFFAYELPADVVLFRRLLLPLLTRSEIEEAVRLDIQTTVPFPPEESVWGWRCDSADNGGKLAVTVAVTSSDCMEQLLPAQLRDEALSAKPEVWAFKDGLPIVLQGFGESARLAAQRKGRTQQLLLAVSASFLLLALLVSPVWLARAQVFDAQDQFESLLLESREVVAARDRSTEARELLDELERWQASQLAFMPLIAVLTERLPDEAYLTGLEVRGEGIIAAGLAKNAASIMEALNEEPRLSELRPSGIARDRVTGLETFRVEFRFVPEQEQP